MGIVIKSFAPPAQLANFDRKKTMHQQSKNHRRIQPDDLYSPLNRSEADYQK